ncbi:MAG TPA: hypothetical protein PK942_07950, partial [Verrucomicrobiota bacterium]|nr:hypothetical protein [Verrucomicrobiota bacterium]
LHPIAANDVVIGTHGLLVSRGARRGLKLGDTVEVRVAEVDTGQRQVDFQLAEPARERRPKPGKPSGKAPPVSRAGGPPANRRLR